MRTYGLEKLGIINTGKVHRNLSSTELVEIAVSKGEGKLSKTGALVVTTGKYTGRSPEDKFIVDTPGIHDSIAWGKVNRPIEKEKFNAIYGKLISYLQNREIFIFDGLAGADPVCRKKFRIIKLILFLFYVMFLFFFFISFSSSLVVFPFMFFSFPKT